MKNQVIIYRFPYQGDRQYLKVVEKKHIKIIKGKKFPEHGHLVDTHMAGNGYHGRCVNCGEPLVTDLGYCSWEGTVCEIKEEKIVTIEYKFAWYLNKSKASKLDYDIAQKYFNELIYKQGWGKYNFQTIKIQNNVKDYN